MLPCRTQRKYDTGKDRLGTKLRSYTVTLAKEGSRDRPAFRKSVHKRCMFFNWDRLGGLRFREFMLTETLEGDGIAEWQCAEGG